MPVFHMTIFHILVWMTLLSALQAAFASNAPRKRWSATELEQRKRDIEASKCDDPADVGMALQIAEYLIQRYLPPDAPWTERQWRRFAATIERRYREASAAGTLTSEALAQATAAKHAEAEARREILSKSYKLNRADFSRVVGHLLTVAGHPLSEGKLSRLFRTVKSDWSGGTVFEDRPAITSAAREWARNYQLVRRAKNAGYEWMVISPAYSCTCRAGATQRVQRTSDILQAFEAGGPVDLLHPSPELACLRAGTPDVCRQRLYPSYEAQQVSSDPVFEQWLERMATERRERRLGGHAAP